MTSETLKALKGSIEKWEKIVDCEGEDEGSNNCDLCKIFNKEKDDYDDNCNGCPVFSKTGKRYCLYTPHEDWCHYSDIGGTGTVFDQKSQNLAIAELEFLKSLLPEEEKCQTK